MQSNSCKISDCFIVWKELELNLEANSHWTQKTKISSNFPAFLMSLSAKICNVQHVQRSQSETASRILIMEENYNLASLREGYTQITCKYCTFFIIMRCNYLSENVKKKLWLHNRLKQHPIFFYLFFKKNHWAEDNISFIQHWLFKKIPIFQKEVFLIK